MDKEFLVFQNQKASRGRGGAVKWKQMNDPEPGWAALHKGLQRHSPSTLSHFENERVEFSDPSDLFPL